VEAFHFPAFLVEGPAPGFAAAVPGESDSGARVEITTAKIGVSDASSMPGT
jgi:hypothetical protein